MVPCLRREAPMRGIRMRAARAKCQKHLGVFGGSISFCSASRLRGLPRLRVDAVGGPAGSDELCGTKAVEQRAVELRRDGMKVCPSGKGTNALTPHARRRRSATIAAEVVDEGSQPSHGAGAGRRRGRVRSRLADSIGPVDEGFDV